MFRNWVGVILAARLIVKCGRQVWYTCVHLCIMSHKFTAWAKSMCDCCFSVYVNAPCEAFWDASIFWLHNTVEWHIQSFFTYIADMLSFSLPAGTDLNVLTYTGTWVCVLNYLSHLQHAHYIKQKTYFSGCQGYSVHIWLHAGIFWGDKTLIYCLHTFLLLCFLFFCLFLTLVL